MTDPHFNWEQHYPSDIGRLGDYLHSVGQRPNCRLDLRITSMEELKKAAVLISELNKTLNHMAYQDERDEVLRVLLARDAMQRARIALKYLRPKRVMQQVPKKNTTRSVSHPIQVGNLDRPWKGPSSV